MGSAGSGKEAHGGSGYRETCHRRADGNRKQLKPKRYTQTHTVLNPGVFAHHLRENRGRGGRRGEGEEDPFFFGEGDWRVALVRWQGGRDSSLRRPGRD